MVNIACCNDIWLVIIIICILMVLACSWMVKYSLPPQSTVNDLFVLPLYLILSYLSLCTWTLSQ